MEELFSETNLELDHQFHERPELTWWGVGTWKITVDGTTIAIDPYLNPTEGIDYALVKHEH